MFIKNIKFTLLLFITLILCSCTQMELTHKAIAYNKALAEFGDKQLLLNAIRASKRLPMYYSNMGAMTATPTLKNASLGSTINFNPFKLVTYNLNPSTEIGSGFSQTTIGPVTSEEYNKAVVKRVEIDTVVNTFIAQGWPIDILAFVLLDQVRISKMNYVKLDKNFEFYCQDHKNKNKCNSARSSFSTCGDEGKNIRSLRGKENRKVGFYFLKNDPFDKCDFAEFRKFAFLLKISKIKLKYKPVIHSEKFKTIKRTTSYKNGTFEGERVNYYQSSDVKEPKSPGRKLIFEYFNHYSGEVDTIEKTGLGEELGVATLTFRSPEDILYYVGELIRAQLQISPEGYLPKYITSSGRLAPLFLVKHGSLGFSKSAVSVSHHGEVYSIPASYYNEDKKHRSLTVLALVKQVFRLISKNKDKPKSPDVIVRTSD